MEISYGQRNENLSKIFTLIIVLLPALNVYATPFSSVSLGEALLVPLIILCALNREIFKIQLNIFNSYLLYSLIISIFSSTILCFSSSTYMFSDAIHRLIRDIYYFIIIVFCGRQYFDFEYGKKILLKVISILSAFIIIQFVAYLLFHIFIPGIIPQLKTSISGGLYGRELLGNFLKTARVDGYLHPNGFLAEPAACAHYISVGILLELFPTDGNPRLKQALFYSLAMLLTLSINAYVAVGVCWGLRLLYSSRNYDNGPVKLLVGIFVGAFLLIVLSRSAAGKLIINRLVEFRNLSRLNSSAVIRVIRGPAFYLKMPIFYQIFGSGFGNFIELKSTYNISTIFESADEYMNTNAYILVSSGLIGFVLYVLGLIDSSKGRVVFSKMLIIMLLIFGISSSLYSSDRFVIMLLFIMHAPFKEIVEDENMYYYPA